MNDTLGHSLSQAELDLTYVLTRWTNLQQHILPATAKSTVTIRDSQRVNSNPDFKTHCGARF